MTYEAARFMEWFCGMKPVVWSTMLCLFGMQQMTANAQNLGDRMVWQAAANKAARDGIDDPTRVREVAEQVVIDTQGSGFIKDLSGSQRGNLGSHASAI